MTTNTSDRGQRGVSRVLTKLKNSIEAGNYYEAHQMYRTLYFRYLSQQKFTECLDLLYGGSMTLISKLEETSAADLGLLIINILEKQKTGVDILLWIDRLIHIIGSLSCTTVERETLINRSITWSADSSGINLGHPLLHKRIAQIFWAEGNIELARHHYLHCRDGNLCGRILIKISINKGFINETDLFIVQAVLQQLCLKDPTTAKETFLAFTKNHPRIYRSKIPFKQPLLNFTYFLFRCIDNKQLDTFQKLCHIYKPSLSRDPSFENYLLKIGVDFLGATESPPTETGIMGAMFGELFSRLFNDNENPVEP